MPFCACVCPVAYACAYALVKTRLYKLAPYTIEEPRNVLFLL